MFIGHYGASLLTRAADRRLSIGAIFLAAQWLDVVWCVLVLSGVEQLRIVPGITATNALDMASMPWSHSLLAALLWGVAAAVFCRVAAGLAWKEAGWLGLVVAGHWVLDLVVHRPDLELGFGMGKVGLGLWNLPIAAFALEAILLAAGIRVSLRGTAARSMVGRFGMGVLGAAMVAIQWLVFFGPVRMTARQTVGWALFGYFAFAILAFALETQRAPGTAASCFLPWVSLEGLKPRRRPARNASAKP